jgi:hypothetical protein
MKRGIYTIYLARKKEKKDLSEFIIGKTEKNLPVVIHPLSHYNRSNRDKVVKEKGRKEEPVMKIGKIGMRMTLVTLRLAPLLKEIEKRMEENL